MSPTVHREGNKRYFFFSREEERMHVHVCSPDGEAKFWLEPVVALADYSGFTKRQLASIQKTVEENVGKFTKKWKIFFS